MPTTQRSAGGAHDGPRHPWLLAAFLLGSPLLVVEAVLATTRDPSNLLVPLSVWGAVNALLLCPALRGRPRPRPHLPGLVPARPKLEGPLPAFGSDESSPPREDLVTAAGRLDRTAR